MSVDTILRWAEEAVEKQDFQRASQLFEDAAKRSVFSEPRNAAYRYMFAAKYAGNDTDRTIPLLKKSQALFERVGEIESAADILMEMAIHAEKAASPGASNLFRQASISFIELIRKALLCEHGDLDRDFVNRLLEKLNLCLRSI